MGLFNKFPYTNFHELNLDWILEQIPLVKKLHSETSEMTSEVHSMTSENSSMTSQVGSMTSENLNLTSENRVIHSQVAKLKDDTKNIYNSTSNLHSQVKAFTSEVETDTKVVQSLKDETGALRNQTQNLKAQTQVIYDNTNTLYNTVNKLTEQNKTYNSQVASMTSENKACNSQVGSMTSENSNMTSENKSLTALTSTYADIAERQKVICSFYAGSASKWARSASQCLTSTVSLTNENIEYVKSASEYSSNVASMTSENKAYTSQVGSMQKVNSAFTSEVASNAIKVESMVKVVPSKETIDSLAKATSTNANNINSLSDSLSLHHDVISSMYQTEQAMRYSLDRHDIYINSLFSQTSQISSTYTRAYLELNSMIVDNQKDIYSTSISTSEIASENIVQNSQLTSLTSENKLQQISIGAHDISINGLSSIVYGVTTYSQTLEINKELALKFGCEASNCIAMINGSSNSMAINVEYSTTQLDTKSDININIWVKNNGSEFKQASSLDGIQIATVSGHYRSGTYYFVGSIIYLLSGKVVGSCPCLLINSGGKILAHAPIGYSGNVDNVYITFNIPRY